MHHPEDIVSAWQTHRIMARTWWFPFLRSRRPNASKPMAMNVASTNDIQEKARLAWISEHALFNALFASSIERRE